MEHNYSKHGLKTFLAILVITAGLVAVSGSTTYISNWSTRQIRASTSYSYGYGDSDFKDKLIEPETWESDSYFVDNLIVDIEIWIEGSFNHGLVKVPRDRSIVAFDNGPDVDIFLAEFGKLTQIDPEHPTKLLSISLQI